MRWFSVVAIFFIIWWTVLFAILPIGLRTQDDEGEVTLGTTSSAPRGAHMLRVVILTTVASVLVFLAFYFVTKILGYGFDDLPHIVPVFED